MAAVLSAAALIACGGSKGGISGTGIFSLGITDAPVDQADEVVVSFTAVELFAEDELAQRFEFEAPRQVDLLALQGGLAENLVDSAAIPAGQYSSIRLIVDSAPPSCQNLVAPFASYISIDGTQYPLAVPSGAQSGLKINGQIEIEAGASSRYVIDFDLRKSISERRQSQCYNLRPVLRLVQESATGTLSGSVDAALLSDQSCASDGDPVAGSAVYIFDSGQSADDVGSANPPLASAKLSSDGQTDPQYSVGFLPAGAYTAALTCQAYADDAEADDDISFIAVGDFEIQAGETTMLDFTASSAAQLQ